MKFAFLCKLVYNISNLILKGMTTMKKAIVPVLIAIAIIIVASMVLYCIINFQAYWAFIARGGEKLIWAVGGSLVTIIVYAIAKKAYKKKGQ